MSSTTKMAWRSLARNRKRSLATGLGIALAMATCMSTLGLMDGLSLDLIRGTVDAEVGHIQAHHPDYLESRRMADTISPYGSQMEKVSQLGDVEAYSRRLYAWGYLTSKSNSAGVQLMGIEPLLEREVTTIHKTLVDGRYVPSEPTPWPEPRDLTTGQSQTDRALTDAAIAAAFDEIEGNSTPATSLNESTIRRETQSLVQTLAPMPSQSPSVVLGSKLASNLSAEVGSTVHLLYENDYGAQGTIDLKVVGVAHTGVDAIDRSRVLIHLNDAQNLLLLKEQAHEVAIRLRDPREAVALAREVQTILNDLGPVKVQAWSEVRPDITALISSNEALMGTLVFIVFLIAGTAVLNTMLVAIMERQKEVSVLKALGQRPSRIVLGVLLETLLLSLAACAVGLVVGVAANLYLQRYGIDVSGFGEFSMSGVNLNPVLRSELTPTAFVLPLVSLIVVSLLAAWIPARIAAKTPVAIGMRSA